MEKLRILLSIDAMDEDFSSLVCKLSNFADINYTTSDDYSLKDYDILIAKKLKEEQLKEANRLKVIFAYKTGVDDFPLLALDKKNIRLYNSHANARIIAEYAFSLSVSLCININKLDYNLRRGIWYDEDIAYWQSIFSLRIGLLGFGQIGQEIYKILKNNQIETYTIDRNHDYDHNIHLVKNLDELIENTDLIIASLPKTLETNHLFDEARLKKMKNKYLVNVGRSNIFDQKELYFALKNLDLKGAALDTWEKKPKDKNSLLAPSKYPINELFNAILSPHNAMKVKDGHRKYVDEVTSQVISYIDGGKLFNLVDLKKGY